MSRRYPTYRRRRRDPEKRRRSVFTRPGMQIAILMVTALIVFIILQSGGR